MNTLAQVTEQARAVERAARALVTSDPVKAAHMAHDAHETLAAAEKHAAEAKSAELDDDTAAAIRNAVGAMLGLTRVSACQMAVVRALDEGRDPQKVAATLPILMD